MKKTSHFFAYLSKMRWIQRWGLKRNAIPENIMEHSFDVATISHTLAVIRNRLYGGELDAAQISLIALYHDASEVLTGDLPTPIKYNNPAIRDAYKALEQTAEQQMLEILPSELQADFAPLLLSAQQDPEIKQIVKAADLLSCYLKCKAEVNAGNPEFSQAVIDIGARLRQIQLPEIEYYCKTFLPSFDLTLDELIKIEEPLL